MALSNAERQRRWREKRKLALRNANGGTLPLALAGFMDETATEINDQNEDQDDFEAVTRDELVADAVLGAFSGMMDAVGMMGLLSYIEDHEELVMLLGGREYLEAAEEWQQAVAARNRKRKHRGDKPIPPAIPGVT